MNRMQVNISCEFQPRDLNLTPLQRQPPRLERQQTEGSSHSSRSGQVKQAEGPETEPDQQLESEAERDSAPEPDYVPSPRYVPYTENSAMRRNKFVSPGSRYGTINPAIMGGFDGDNDSIWLVDDSSSIECSLRRSVSSASAASKQQTAFHYRYNPTILDGDYGSENDNEHVDVDQDDESQEEDHVDKSNDPQQDTLPIGEGTSHPYVDAFEARESAMTLAYLRHLDLSERRGEEDETDDFRFGQRYQREGETCNILFTSQRVPADSQGSRQECIVCTERKDTAMFPQFSLTLACTHKPNTCLDCVETSIRSDLTSKLWSDIRCPECREFLDYTDIQRYADKATFERYENLALRAAMSESESFVWCTSGCGFGQMHVSGKQQPIVTCAHCGHRSCFEHRVAWHENLGCEEYEELLADPDNFRSRFDMDNDEWERAQAVLRRGRERQREQEQEAAQEREHRRRAQQALAVARRIAARRKREEEESQLLVRQTTKPCPGCGWAIERNKGCSHMTCIKCRFEFCWGCHRMWSSCQNINCRRETVV